MYIVTCVRAGGVGVKVSVCVHAARARVCVCVCVWRVCARALTKSLYVNLGGSTNNLSYVPGIVSLMSVQLQ